LAGQFAERNDTRALSFEQQIENVFEGTLHGANLPAVVSRRKPRPTRGSVLISNRGSLDNRGSDPAGSDPLIAAERSGAPV
jgi:hypothetical protein